MKNLRKYIEAAHKGGFSLWRLNFILGLAIPFNRPHGIRIQSISTDEVKTVIRYKRVNMNHIRGIHACGLATAAEFASGLLLLSRLDPARFRIIMKSLQMEYHYQAKSDVTAVFQISDQVMQQEVILPLQEKEKVYKSCIIELHDTKGNHIATATTGWQIKSWENVRTRL